MVKVAVPLVAWAAVASAFSAVPQAGKPHIVLILADDYGHANLGYNARKTGNKQLIAETNTPNLDALIDDGVYLSQHYSYAVCAPSRSSLQSGRFGSHVNMFNTAPEAVNSADPISGYETFIVYYKHANDYWNKRGSFLATGEVDMCLSLMLDFFSYNETYRGGNPNPGQVTDSCKCQEGTETGCENGGDENTYPSCFEETIFMNAAMDRIRAHDTSQPQHPLFLFHSFHFLHTPLEAPIAAIRELNQTIRDKGGDPINLESRLMYNSMVLLMDKIVGRLVQTLVGKGMFENTLLAFLSDNGGPIYLPAGANNYPLKGGKWSDWQGGVLANAFISGGVVPASIRGTVHAGIFSIADWYTTFAEVAGLYDNDEMKYPVSLDDGVLVDQKAKAANDWMDANRLDETTNPRLPPLDGVPQWAAILAGRDARDGNPIHISPQALVWKQDAGLLKLVTGKQYFGRHVGPVFPNCSTLQSGQNLQGPARQTVKFLDIQYEPSTNQEQIDTLTWTEDCGGGCLYDLASDPTESNDLASDPAFAVELERMQAKLAALNATLFLPNRGDQPSTACDSFINHGGFYGPFMALEQTSETHQWGYVPDFYKGGSPPWPLDRTPDEVRTMISIVNKPKVLNCLRGLIGDVWPSFFNEVLMQTVDTCSLYPNPTPDVEEVLIPALDLPVDINASSLVQWLDATCEEGYELGLEAYGTEPNPDNVVPCEGC